MDIVKIIDTQVVTLSWHNYHLVPSDSTLYDSAFAPTPTKEGSLPCANTIFIICSLGIQSNNIQNQMLSLSLLLVATFTFIQAQPRACIYTDRSYGQLANLAHQIQQSQSCMPCLPECTTCTSATDRTCSNGNCESRYFYHTANSECVGCPNMCQECSSATSCANCVEGYYLESAACHPCPPGVSLCTSSSILECSTGYYYDVQAYVCRKCSDPSCVACSGKAKCEQCQTGYFLSSDPIACWSCQVPNCELCTGAGLCSQCRRGYQLQSSNLCARQNCTSISKCKQCDYANSTLVCTLCQSGFYLLNNTCNFGASMMCAYSLTPSSLLADQKVFQPPMNRLVDYGSCLGCNPTIAEQAPNSQNYCLPKLIGKASALYIQYRAEATFMLCQFPYMTVSTPSRFLNYYYEIPPSFKINLTAVLVVINAPSNLTAYANFSSLFSLQLNLNHSLLISHLESYPLACTPLATPLTFIVKVAVSLKIETGSAETGSPFLQGLNMSLGVSSEVNGMLGAELAGKQMYMEISRCTRDKCLQCRSASSCTKCMSPYFIQNFNCVLACDVGYYVNNLTRTCSSDCEPGYFFDVVLSGLHNYCLPCPTQCTACLSFLRCTQCNPGFLLTFDGQCQLDCSDTQYYPSQADQTCKRCQNPCKTCSRGPHNCTACLVGFHYANLSVGVCVLNCPSGYYPKVLVKIGQQSSSECVACLQPCLSCEMEQTLCTSCGAGYFLLETRCLQVCPDGYFGTTDEPIADFAYCKKCSPPCARCIGYETNCTECSPSLSLLVNDSSGSCVLSCPAGSYANFSSQRCLPCPGICTQCSYTDYALVCSGCAPGYLVENYQCVPACTRGWPAGGLCHLCPYPCATCHSTNHTFLCNSCAYGYYLHTGLCVLVCELGDYGDWQNQSCVPCPTQCTRCFKEINETTVHCTECASGYLSFNQQCLASTGGCPSGHFDRQSKCEQCSQDCSQCEGASGRCTRCHPNKYLLVASGECLANCPHGWLPNDESMVCLQCSRECSQCSTVASNCTLCRTAQYQFYNSTSRQWTCLPSQVCESLEGSFPNTQTSICQTCQLPCLKCTSPSLCTRCDIHNYLFQGSCVSQCPVGHYANSLQCLPCPQPCTSCLSFGECLACKPNYFYAQSSRQCLEECPGGKFGDLGSKVCETCKFPCSTCANRQYCLTCSSIVVNDRVIPLMLLDGRCLTPCPDGYFTESVSGNQQCQKCPNDCQTCVSWLSCTTCSFGYFLITQRCVSSADCPTQFYPDSNTRACSPCQPPCFTCMSPYQCSSCLLGYSLKDNFCYISCPIGTYDSNSSCLPCPSSCARCLSPLRCLECRSDYYMVDGWDNRVSTCVSWCPEGTYLDVGESVCSNCSLACRGCKGRANNCTSCSSDKLLQNGMCVDTCSRFYFQKPVPNVNPTHRYCQKCNVSCSTCLHFQVCLACDSSYLLQTNKQIPVLDLLHFTSYCSPQCPPATFKDTHKFFCQPCSQGCLLCKNSQNCLQCSRQHGYVLFNTKCLPLPCPPYLYTLADDNRCVQRSYCDSNPALFNIYDEEKQCFRKQISGCPSQLVLKDGLFCLDSCPEGYAVNFERLCVKNSNKGERFTIEAIRKDGYIEVVIKLNITTQASWIQLFRNVSVSRGTGWDMASGRLLLSSEIPFKRVEPVQKFNNVLTLLLVPEAEISEATDLTITASMSPPFSNQICLNGLPLQNWRSSTTVESYIATSEQLKYFPSNPAHRSAPAIVLIVLLLLASLLNLFKSGKIYLLIPSWDFIQFIYFLLYFNIYWPPQARAFFTTFFVLCLKWFDIERTSLVFSPERVHSISIDMNLLSNTLCCIVLISAALLFFITYFLIRRKNIQNKGNKKQDSSEEKFQNQLLNSVINSQIPLKILLSISYLSIPNIFYFSLLNSLYLQSSLVSTFISAIILALIIVGLLYCFFRQMKEKNFLDKGINPLKKTIIISLPLYLMLRKMFIILFLAIFPSDAAFPLCFGLITTIFIIILICWFEPFKNRLRHKLALAHEFAIFLFFLFCILYVCNHKEMMQTDLSGLIVFLVMLVFVAGMAYPAYHLWILLNFPKLFAGVVGQAAQGYCIEDENPAEKIIQKLESQNNGFREDQKWRFGQYVGQKESEAFNGMKGVSRQECWNEKLQSKIQGKDGKIEEKKKNKLKLPKDRLIENQTDHEADESSQEGQKKKMRLADYTVRLTRKDTPALINNLKNYDLNTNQATNDAEGLAEKQIQLSRLLQKQKFQVRNKQKIIPEA